jgi:molybdate transport repressor ModE-like protein
MSEVLRSSKPGSRGGLLLAGSTSSQAGRVGPLPGTVRPVKSPSLPHGAVYSGRLQISRLLGYFPCRSRPTAADRLTLTGPSLPSALSLLHLSVRRIEVFVAVVDCGSFSAAAAQLGISQPSVSEHVRALEIGIGETLIERRRGRASRPTPAGNELLLRARNLLAQVAEFSAHISAGKQRKQRRIVIASQRRISTSVLPTLLAGFTIGNPETEFVVKSGSMEEVLAMLNGGVADVGYFLCNEPVAAVESTVVTHEPFIFVAGANHPWAERKRIAPSELATQRFIRGASGSLLGRQVDALLASVGLTHIDVASRSTDDGIILQMIMSGVGINFAMEKSVEPHLRTGQLRKLHVTAPKLSIAVRQAVPTRLRPSALTRKFCRFVESHWPK